MEWEEYIDRSAAYAAGALGGEDLRQFESYLRSSSAEEQSLLAELVGTASLLPLVLERKAPRPDVREQLMRKVRLSLEAEHAVQRREDAVLVPSPRRNWMPFGVAIAIGMVALFSLFALKLLNTIDDQNRHIVADQRATKDLRTQLTALRDELTRKEELLKVLASKRIEITVLNGLKPSPVSYGKIIWDPERRTAILQVSNLPPVPSDKDYQLWIIKDKKPISAGVFAVKTTEPNYFKIENLAVTDPRQIGGFAVTLEPKGGVPQPTGEMYIAGSPKM